MAGLPHLKNRPVNPIPPHTHLDNIKQNAEEDEVLKVAICDQFKQSPPHGSSWLFDRLGDLDGDKVRSNSAPACRCLIRQPA
jgi:hypothetical protein